MSIKPAYINTPYTGLVAFSALMYNLLLNTVGFTRYFFKYRAMVRLCTAGN